MATSTLSILLLTLHCSVAAASALKTHVRPRQAQTLNVPSSQDFVNRNYHAAAELGRYLYVDGGDVSYYDNGVFRHVPDNNTYAIDLSTNWTNDTVALIPIEKAAPVLCYSHLWPDRTNHVMYSFGGAQCVSLPVDESPPVPPTSLWRFTPSGSTGSGSWSEVTDVHGLSGITRPAGASSTFGGGSAYLLGGYSTNRTSSETSNVLGAQPLPGILIYNYTTNTFSNNSAANFNAHGTSEFGEMHFIKGQNGHHGLLAAFGGDYSTAMVWNDNGAKLRSFSTIHLYNPTTDTWMNQTASGNIPEPRDRFCATAIAGDSGTFEIFIFGGHVASATSDPEASANPAKQTANIARDEVFVLTIPGFNWEKAAYPPSWPRFGHTCNLAGNRQMVVVGGVNPAATTMATLLSQKDPWPNGIGVFDVTEMQWTSQYDANAAAYVTPRVVKNWYASNGGYYPKTWDDPALEQYFTGSAGTVTTPPSSTTSAPSSGSSAPSTASSSSSTGALVGGVVGGVGGALIIVAFLWFFLHRRKAAAMRKRPADAYSLRSRDDRGPVVPHAAGADIEKTLPLPAELPEKGSGGAPAELDGMGTAPDGKEPQWSDTSTLRSPVSPMVEAPEHNGRVELQA